MAIDKDEQRTLNEILIHVGETRKGIAGLETDVRDIRKQFEGLNKETVKKPECTERHRIVAASIGDLKGDLSQIKKDVRHIRITTSEDNPAITSKMLAQRDGAEKKRDLRYWVSVGVGLTVLLSFFGSIIWGVISAGRYLERMDALAKAAQKQQAEIRTQLHLVDKAASAIVGADEAMKRGPIQPDAGVSPAAGSSQPAGPGSQPRSNSTVRQRPARRHP